MNKIERVISDIKLHIENLRKDKIILNAEISAFEKNLELLERVERNNSIPHSNPSVIVVSKGSDETNEMTYTEEQVRGAIQKARHSYAVSNDIIQSLKQPKKD